MGILLAATVLESNKKKGGFYMTYWIMLFISFTILISTGIVIWKKKIKDDDMENNDFIGVIIIGCIALIVLIPFAIDLPSAIRGGQEIYVNELPTRYNLGTHFSYVETDNEELKNLKLGNWENYEKYGKYRIRHTEPIKFVLKIEKLD